ncbi:MAG: hypothetical protein A3I61_06460 [Acidobacteria bacterium RIFCSPLOWO2_02_FULL_68_18]|nr:MAG: hypothetical protein A3I61_06460 [Acidobacteria bacterium RIFCSPLOWO2_02_FULL_68_18]OFW50299.1 MAG: hypothetical protein A3G77_07455 [Acidobacteria bacterium RIFCSPLOWO2_12_FULL_68_19]
MDARPLLAEVARRLNDARLDAVLIGNAAAALPVAALDDIIKSKRGRGDPATWPCWTFWRRPVRKRRSRKARLAAVRCESERAVLELIRRRLALAPERRTNFLRKRVGIGRSAL